MNKEEFRKNQPVAYRVLSHALNIQQLKFHHGFYTIIDAYNVLKTKNI